MLSNLSQQSQTNLCGNQPLGTMPAKPTDSRGLPLAVCFDSSRPPSPPIRCLHSKFHSEYDIETKRLTQNLRSRHLHLLGLVPGNRHMTFFHNPITVPKHQIHFSQVV